MSLTHQQKNNVWYILQIRQRVESNESQLCTVTVSNLAVICTLWPPNT